MITSVALVPESFYSVNLYKLVFGDEINILVI